MKEINQAFVTHLRGLGLQAFMEYAPEKIGMQKVERPYIIVTTQTNVPADTMPGSVYPTHPLQGDVTTVRLDICSKEDSSDEAYLIYRKIDTFFNYINSADFVIFNRQTIRVWRDETSGPQRDAINGWIISTIYSVESTA